MNETKWHEVMPTPTELREAIIGVFADRESVDADPEQMRHWLRGLSTGDVSCFAAAKLHYGNPMRYEGDAFRRRARGVVRKLRDEGVVYSYGSGAGTRYMLAEFNDRYEAAVAAREEREESGTIRAAAVASLLRDAGVAAEANGTLVVLDVETAEALLRRVDPEAFLSTYADTAGV